MTLKLHIPENRELKPRLTVFGVGGAGGNAVNNMIARSLEGVDFVVANTDAQALALNDAAFKIQLGEELTEGLGAGAKPEVGAGAAEESLERIIDVLKGSHMCFITAGMGGGTGTGAAPIIAQAARELGILTVGVVTKPFTFEGGRRMKLADEGIHELQQYVDTLIIIPNQNLFLLANEQTTFSEAFGMADDVLYQGVKGVTDLMVLPGMVNLDFADIRSVMDEMGKAMMGTGEAEGADRAIVAAERAIDNPLLDEISLKGARGVLINITGGDDMSLFEVDEASNKIREQVDPDANIIFGSTLDPSMSGRIRVSVVATGIDAEENELGKTNGRRTVAIADAKNDLFSEPAEQPEEVVAQPAAAQTEAYTAPSVEPGYYEAEQPSQIEMPIEPVAVSPEVSEPQTYQPQAPVEPQMPMTTPLERMQRAVHNEPANAPSATDDSPLERKRFGLDSVFKRMTGQEDEKAPSEGRVIQPAEPIFGLPEHSEPPEQPGLELEDTERERVDIPAFLRRQAN